MKKLLTLITLLFLWVNNSPAQQKVTFTIAPYRIISAGIVSYMVKATVPAGQVWKVGNFNLRISFGCNPTGSLQVHTDTQVDSALSGLVGGIYNSFTTTAFTSGISMNLLSMQTSGFLNLGPGTYNLGHIRFNIGTSFISDTLKFRNPPFSPTSIVYDSTRKCAYSGTNTDSSRYSTIDPIITGVEGNISAVPTEYQMYQNYPNPFNPVTNIKFDVPKSGLIKIKIFDLTGKLVDVLVNGEMKAGSYEVKWNGTNYASGIYFYKFESVDYTKVERMVLIK
jgi:hypothetical protein